MKNLTTLIAALFFTAAMAAKPTPPPPAKQAPVAVAPVPTHQAEDSEPSRAKNRFGIGAWLLGPGLLGSIYISYYFLPTLDFEVGATKLSYAGIGYVAVHSGPKWHIFGGDAGQRWSPYIGVQAQYFYVSATSSASDSTSFSTSGSDFGFYIPVGLELVAYNGFNFAIELAYAYTPKISSSASSTNASISSEFNGPNGLWGGAKIGYRF